MKRKLKFTLKAWPVIFLIAVALSWLTGVVAKQVFGIELPEQNQVEAMRRLFRNGPVSLVALNLALVVAVMPILEEFVFRWATRFGWKRRAGAALWAVSSALFAAAHYLQAPFPDNAFLALFAFGLCQCWLYRRLGSIWYPILNHSLFNLTNLAFLLCLI